MTRAEKIKEYRIFSGLTKKEVATLGDFAKSEQWLGQCENGKVNMNEENEKEIFDAINVARCKKRLLEK